MNVVGEYWQALGRGIERRLAGGKQTPAAFAEVATDVLRAVPPPPITATAIADWIVGGGRLPEQVNMHSGFGEPPLVVFQSERFYLEVLFWFPGRTAIHGHGFSGAFMVLDGLSVQAEFAFQEESRPEDGVRLGRLEPSRVEFIAPGHVYAIVEGDGFIHSVTHLGNPSLTLVARTYASGPRRQFRYHRCGFAVLSAADPVITRQAEVLAAVHDGAPEAFPARLSQLLDRSNGYQFYSFLSALLGQLRVHAFQRDVLSLVEGQFGPTRPAAVAAIREAVRTANLWTTARMLPNRAQQVQCALADVFPDGAEREAILCRSYGVSRLDQVPAPWQVLLRQSASPGEMRP